MAKRIDTNPRRRTLYPWHEWEDGENWRALEGEDFFCSTTQFQQTLHIRARNKGKKVTTASPEDGIVEFRFING